VKRVLFILLLLVGLLFVLGCAKNTEKQNSSFEVLEAEPKYANISPSDAKKLLENEQGIVLLDVRTIEEHKEVRIPGSILIPYDVIEQEANVLLPEKETVILVYCRTGRRSVIAAEALVKMGYTNVKNLGGIIDWPYETVSGEVQ